ncbi:6-bladed beta-propeller [Roseivirga sp.]|uniref:6-bladed beta-propeller n=1 Tax=Roseivirga sp. TaxID=1964215 RepID=UPI002B2667C2|nr:6-bladed beta-propeller [Roseivirga sp.]
MCLFSAQVIGQGKVSDSFVSYDLSKNDRKIKLTDLIDEVEFINLEETQESLLGSVGGVHVVGDKFVFMGDRFKGDIFVFSTQGKFINRINRQGSAPEEYPAIKDIWIEGDLIAVHTSLKDIKRYRLNGDFANSSKLKLTAGHALGNSGNYFLDMNFNSLEDQSKYKVVRLDGNMGITGKYLPFTKAPVATMFSPSPLFEYKKSIGYYRAYSDTVYFYQKDRFVPFIHFEFGNNWHWDNYDPFGPDVIKGLRDGEKVWSIKPKVGSRYIITSSLYGKSGKLRLEHVIDRRNAETILIDLERTSKKESFDLEVSHWESDDTFYAFLPSMDAVGLVTEASAKNWSFRGGTSLEEIASSENPVLVRIRIKDFSKK